MPQLKLFMLLLGCKPPGRHTEQHDVFFGIGYSLNDLVPEIKAFWPEPERIHIDAWREVTVVDGHRVVIDEKAADSGLSSAKKLFFINLGGYLEGKFEEQHYFVLTAKENRTAAFNEAKQTVFFKHEASSHIDDKYGIDVDDLYEIEEILSPAQKDIFHIRLEPADGFEEDALNLGYLKLSKLEDH